MKNLKITVSNPSGLHARPASAFVRATTKFDSNVSFKKADQVYNAKSIIAIMSACVKCNEEIEILADGEDEDEAIDAIAAAIRSGLGEQI